MASRRLGCLSGSGLIAVAITLLLSLGVIAVRGGQWFSPGALNAQTSGAELGGVASHAATGGQCQVCHSAPWEPATLTDRCLACHTAVADQLTDPTSLHGALKSTQAAMACRACHTEHRGAQANLTHLDTTTFPHDAVGYTLSGHANLPDGRAFACADCHTEKLAVFDVAVCARCHRETDAAYVQQHVADFGAACLGCHDGADRYGKRRFDHNGLPFPLTGKHTGVACAGCHANARTAADLRAAPKTCVGCHQRDDAHRGQLGSDCAACHQTAGWKPATFDHARSAFPLTGKHVGARCEGCHAGQVFKGAPKTCVGCHQDPAYHLGAFGAACADCHTAAGWRPARYNRPHTFPLDHGKAGVSSCKTCHPAQLNAYTCYGCHDHTPADIERKHVEEGIRDFANCARCHPTGREEEGEEGKEND